MGTVFRGRDEKLGRDVAIKLMSATMMESPELVARFEREALSVARLSSAHVVAVYDYGIERGVPFMVMELLRGESLGQRLRCGDEVDMRLAARWFSQICLGLRAAHEAGLVHRDIKPSNVFLAERDGAEVATLLDFGVVKTLEPLKGSNDVEDTTTGTLLGTPQYMSPEQARAVREIDHRSDLWSAAVIAFRLLCGRNPFRGGSVTDVVLRICSDELPRPRDVNPSLPLPIDAFFDRAFARDPAARWGSVDEMLAAFHAALGTTPDLSISNPRLSMPSRPSMLESSPEPPTQVLPRSHGPEAVSPSVAGTPSPLPRPSHTSPETVSGRWVLAAALASISVAGGGILYVAVAGPESEALALRPLPAWVTQPVPPAPPSRGDDALPSPAKSAGEASTPTREPSAQPSASVSPPARGRTRPAPAPRPAPAKPERPDWGL